jgi:hypothetical protein
MAKLPSAPGLCSLTKDTPVFFSTISATIKNDISLPAPGPLGKSTVMGLVGCQANTKVGINVSSVKNRFMGFLMG